MTTEHYSRDTEEFVSATVTTSVTLTSQAVVISVNRSDEDYDWLDAEWVGSPGTTRTVRTSDPVVFDETTYPELSYQVFVQVTDSPEIPIMAAGQITVG